ncbi:helix-turn-helix domain-containing protein [Herbaspirillum sp. HC18]|nr:helix-turn-helix domain-containing protein [Herbaspirillum sp. HC18]
MAIYMDAAQAAEALGVRRETLYAYVSRGLIRSRDGDGKRSRKYHALDIERLAARKSRSRKPKLVAQATLDWGLPVMESALTLIEDGRLYYRGWNALELAQSSSLEDVARLLWGCAAGHAFPAREAMPSLHWRQTLRALADQSPLVRCEALFAQGRSEVEPGEEDHAAMMNACMHLLRLLTASMLGTEPSADPIHVQCREKWRLDSKDADTIRMALVVCADHELNASSFTARCIASTGANIGAAILGGLAALSGPWHGGFTERVETLFDELEASRSVARALKARVDRGVIVPGFGHPLYPDGDPRAKAILTHLPRNKTLDTIIATVEKLTGLKPTIDFALVAARRSLGLPRGSAFALFAISRTTGWIAHALEQRGQKRLIRPRANYTGPKPVEDNTAESTGRVIRFTAA